MPEGRLDQHFAVFNCHLNHAKRRANREFEAQFGKEVYDQHIAPCHEAGIMSIFDAAPTIHTMAWVTLATAFVNEGRV